MHSFCTVQPAEYYSIKCYYLLGLKFSKHDTAVVAAPDGTIYLVEINSGKVLWSFASGSAIYSSYQAVHHNEGQRNNATTWADDFFIDIGEDWQLYVNGNGLKNVVSEPSV